MVQHNSNCFELTCIFHFANVSRVAAHQRPVHPGPATLAEVPEAVPRVDEADGQHGVDEPELLVAEEGVDRHHVEGRGQGFFGGRTKTGGTEPKKKEPKKDTHLLTPPPGGVANLKKSMHQKPGCTEEK